MSGVSSPVDSSQIVINKVSTHCFENCLLLHTTAVAVGIVLILASVIGLVAYAYSLPIFCSVLLLASILIGIVLIMVGAKYIHTCLSKTDFVDSSEREGYRTKIRKLFSEAQDLEMTIRKQQSRIMDMENTIDNLFQLCSADYAEKIENMQLQLDEQQLELEESANTLNIKFSVLEAERDAWKNLYEEEVQVHHATIETYEDGIQKVSKELYEANQKIKEQRLELRQAKERAKLMERVHHRLTQELEVAKEEITELRAELVEASLEPGEPGRPRSMSI
ncbi:chromosome segregation protein SMC,IncA protein [Chlamydia poikilotherma]|uniref:Chromosome segregation protein SMC,IncA protein n=1 Tax=Chlamydia poikilotherma TaxID=1967783 RepID=A0A3B0PSU8_9CHLA|nr:IncA family protein [Chlamydia poikilotherma]SYX09258.1 chromosome segregation protein SMC,IncA protein [Chlamydia poikilotherma]